jgi:hypothetical protein
MSQIKGKQVQPASTTNSGVLTSAAQTVFGQKTFDSLAAETVVVASLKNNVATVGSYVSSQPPEGVITAAVGSTCRDATSGVFYIKQTGAGNTGWVSMPSRVYSTATQGYTTTANTLIPGLSIAQPANTVAAYRAVVFWTTSTTTRAMQFAIAGPGTLGAADMRVGSGANGNAYHFGYVITAFNTRFGPTTTSAINNRSAAIDFVITTAGAGGNVQILASISAVTGTVSSLAGSYLEQRILS